MNYEYSLYSFKYLFIFNIFFSFSVKKIFESYKIVLDCGQIMDNCVWYHLGQHVILHSEFVFLEGGCW